MVVLMAGELVAGLRRNLPGQLLPVCQYGFRRPPPGSHRAIDRGRIQEIAANEYVPPRLGGLRDGVKRWRWLRRQGIRNVVGSQVLPGLDRLAKPGGQLTPHMTEQLVSGVRTVKRRYGNQRPALGRILRRHLTGHAQVIDRSAAVSVEHQNRLGQRRTIGGKVMTVNTPAIDARNDVA